jgi:hypothetical protein
LDEVDRLLAVSGRYATLRDKRANKREERPVIEILRKIFYRRSRSEFAQIQVVAASATVGRPLRRELSKIVSADGEYGDLTVIRPEAGDEIYSSIKQTGRERMKASPPKKTKKKGDFLDELYNDLDELNIENEHDGDDGDADDRDMDTDILKDPDFGGPQQAAKPQRPIGIPDAIEHVAYLADQENMNLAKKIGFVRGIWKGVREGSRGILFVPKEDDVSIYSHIFMHVSNCCIYDSDLYVTRMFCMLVIVGKADRWDAQFLGTRCRGPSRRTWRAER